MSVLLSIFGGAALPIISRIFTFGLSIATMVGIGVWLAMKAPLPVRLASGCIAVPCRWVRWVRAWERLEIVEASEELPDADPVEMRPGKDRSVGGCFLGYVN